MKKKHLHQMSKQEYEHLLHCNHGKLPDPIETELEGFLVYCPYCGPVYLSSQDIIDQRAEECQLYSQLPLSALDFKSQYAASIPPPSIHKFKGLKEVITFRCECHLVLSIECLMSGNGNGQYHTKSNEGGHGWRG